MPDKSFGWPLQNYLQGANLDVKAFNDGHYVHRNGSSVETGDVVSVRLSNQDPYKTLSIANVSFHPLHVSVQKTPTEAGKGGSINIVEALDWSLSRALGTSYT